MSRTDVLLLGGGGFIGTALAQRLVQDKVRVHSVSRHDGERLEQLLPECGTVIHLACDTTPGSSARQPELELGNLALTLRLLELLRMQPETHLIFFSSGGTVFGNPEHLPVTEDSPIAPLSNHGAAKAAQEAFCQAHRAHGHAVTILRPANAYGPGQTIKSGFGLIRTMLECARTGMPLEVWGDGENVRDYIYIDDVVAATTRLVNLPQDSGTYNLGSGVGHSVNKILHVVEKTTRTTLTTIQHPARGIDVRAVVLDICRIKDRLSWGPETNIEDGVKTTWEWLLRLP